jgi:hypothetical protein
MSRNWAAIRRQCRLGFHYLAILALSGAAAHHAAAGMRDPADPDKPAVLDCDPPSAAPATSCVFRASPGAKIEAFSTKDEDAEQDPSASFVRFSTAKARELGYREADLLLIDVTRGLNNGRVGTLQQTKALAREIINRIAPTARLAVATFGTGLHVIAPFDQSRTSLLDAVDGIGFTEVNTRFYGSLLEAVGVLRDQDATLGRIILLSDGLPEDDRSVNERKVVRAAIDAGVSVAALALYWNRGGSELNGRGGDVMRTLAEETLGTFDEILVHSQPITAARLLDRIEEQRANSGFVQVVDAPRSTQISVRVSLQPGRPGTPASQTYVATLQNPAVKPIAPPPPPPPPWKEWFWAIVAGAAAMALIAISWLVLSSRSRRVDEEDSLASVVEPDVEDTDGAAKLEDTDGATRAIRNDATADPAMAFIFRADAKSEPYVVRGSRVRIGRSGDNDLILAHDSVSRVHAEVHKTRSGVFAIRDAGSLNKVRVNGAEVDSADLCDGDLIQLGDACLRFEYPKPGPR